MTTLPLHDVLDSVILGDCLDVLPSIPDTCVDMVLADLPSGQTNCRWDSLIPLDRLWEQWGRIVQPHGAIVLTATQPFASALVMSNPRWFRHDWIWQKSALGNFMLAKYRPLAGHEHVLVFSRKPPCYYPQMEKGEPIYCVSGRKPLYLSGSEKVRRNTVSVKNDGLRYPRTIQSFPFARGSKERRIQTQKPVSLFAYLIRTYSRPGNIVLDNVMGSGTTGVAALEEGRHFVGIEKDPDHWAICCERITQSKEHVA